MVAPKVRADSWASLLTSEQQWALYDFHYQTAKGKWELSAAWAAKEFELANAPSRAAFYTWKAQMDELEKIRHEEIRSIADQRIEEAAKGIEVADPKIQRALMAEAMNRALVEKNGEAAGKFITMVTNLIQAVTSQKAVELKAQEVTLKTSAERRKDEELEIAKRKLALLEQREAAANGALSDKKLTDADKLAKMKEIFG